MNAPACPVAAQNLNEAPTENRPVKSELYRNEKGHEVWRIYEEKPDGSFLVLHEDVASDYDMMWLMDAARHGVSHGID
jgi:hypothetical protein